MDKLYWLNQIQPQDHTKVGDKAFNLSRILQLGHPVVPGFVISSEVTREFLKTLNSTFTLVADLPDSSLHLDVSNWRQLQLVASRLRQEIIVATVPSQWVNMIYKAAQEWETSNLIFRPTVALPFDTNRVNDFSGLLESQICRCEQGDITFALKRAWSQIFRARSLVYWQQFGIQLQQIHFGILVQPLVDAVASGTLATNASLWEIQASWGLEIAIERGEVIPDYYRIQRETGRILEQKLGNKIIAYRLNDEANTSPLNYHSFGICETNYLTNYMVEESEQQQLALPHEFLQQLIELTNNLVGLLGTNFNYKWTVSAKNNIKTLYITQLTLPQSPVSDVELLIKGLGAASGSVAATAYVVNSLQNKPKKLPQGAILVTSKLTVDWLPLLHKVSGIITESGGMTSHAAILARELKIPAIVNASEAVALIKNGDKLFIDGSKGEIYSFKSNRSRTKSKSGLKLSPSSSPETEIISHLPQKQFPASLNLEQLNIENNQIDTFELELKPDFPSSTMTFETNQSVIATQLFVNLSQTSSLAQIKNLPIDGVGLVRSELMAIPILEQLNPNAWLQQRQELLQRWCEQILLFAQALTPRPVFYRSLDSQIHNTQATFTPTNHAHLSVLGERGTFGYLQNPDMFELELEAIAQIQQAGYHNLRLILPFVRSVEEFIFCRQKVEQAGLHRVSQFQLWIMAEVPSVLFMLPEYIQAGVQGIAIGTNDLTQLLLGVDREQGQLTQTLNEQNPAVIRAIHQLIDMAKTAGIPCSICGQAPTLYPELIDQLVRWGITSISVEPEALQKTYHAIARAEQRLILEAARRVGSREWEK